ncbi:hypothetical protein C8J57DRAFT_1084450, partial [Mycena rebaudengoi]
DLVRDNMIYNMTGLKGHGQGADLNLEHNIGKVKASGLLFCAKGIYGSWERLANISAAIDVLDCIKKNIAISLQASYSGSGHKKFDASDLIWRVANKARELELQRTKITRTSKANTDILPAGAKMIKSSTMATFNKNRRELLKGNIVEEEEDEIPKNGIVIDTDEDSST